MVYNIINQYSYKFMARIALLLTIAAVLSLGTAFEIQNKTVINWPFNICGQGPWVMKSLTLSAQPSRNLDVQAVAVNLI